MKPYKVAKCGSPDSKYMSYPNKFDEDIQIKLNEKKEFQGKVRELLLGNPSKIEDRYYQAIQVLKQIKEKLL